LSSGGALGTGGLSSGAGDAGAEAGTPIECVTDLSGVGTGDFSIRFTLTTTEIGLTLALVSQRGDCLCVGSGPYCPTPSTFWDIVLQRGTVIAITAADSAESYVSIDGGSSVADGRPHRIVVGRTSGTLWYEADGIRGPVSISNHYLFKTFPELSIGSDGCELAASPTTPLAGHGTLTDLCLSAP